MFQRPPEMSIANPATEWNPWPFRMAGLLVCATFPLIWVGGLVTTYEAGMAVPDWPSTYGYNLFLYPWQTWLLGPWDIFIEHGHRLLGATVGFLAIGLVATVWRQDDRLWMRWAAIAALALVIFQGVLGGQRVVQNSKQLAQLHGVIGPTFLAFATFLLVATSRFWRSHRDGKGTNQTSLVSWLIWLAVALAWLQLMLGSQLRHADGLTSASLFGWALKLHVSTAVLFLAWVALLVVLTRSCDAEVRTPTRCIGLLVLGQIGLGLCTWVLKYGWPAILAPMLPAPALTVQADSMLQSTVVTTHQAIGAVILASCVFAASRASRFAVGTRRQVVAASTVGATA